MTAAGEAYYQQQAEEHYAEEELCDAQVSLAELERDGGFSIKQLRDAQDWVREARNKLLIIASLGGLPPTTVKVSGGWW